MKLEHAKRIVRAAQAMGLDLSLRESYSGRGMYGRTTAGVVGNRGAIIRSVVAAGADLARTKPEEVDAFIDDMKLGFDSMGQDVIAY